MTEREFGQFVNDLCNFFERKKPTEAASVLWFDKCRNIPAEPLHWITTQIQGHEAFPKNLPTAAWSLYQKWLDSHPEKKQRKFERNCHTPECEDGLLFCHKHDPDNGMWHGYAFRCPCERSDALGISIMGKGALIELGYVFVRLPEMPSERLWQSGNLEFAEVPW